MRVGSGDCRALVTDDVLNDRGRRAGIFHQRGGGVPQRMETDIGKLAARSPALPRASVGPGLAHKSSVGQDFGKMARQCRNLAG